MGAKRVLSVQDGALFEGRKTREFTCNKGM